MLQRLRTPVIISAKNRDVLFKSCIGKYSCIYLFEIPQLSQNNKVYKYGYTNNLIRRNDEHHKTYGNNIKLKYHAHIPPYYLRDAEKDIRNYFHKADWEYQECKQFKELVAIPDTLLEQTAEVYNLISDKYNISYERLQIENELLKQIVFNKK